MLMSCDPSRNGDRKAQHRASKAASKGQIGADGSQGRSRWEK